MNKYLITKDEEAIVIEENGFQREIENSDNLKEILKKENTIEVISNSISKLEENKKNRNTNRNTSDILRKGCLVIALSALVADLIIFSPLVGNLLEMLAILVATLALPIYAFFKETERRNESLKVYDAQDCQLEYLNEQLQNELKKLESLRNEVSLDNQEGHLKIESIEEINPEVRRNCYKSYEVGYNLDKNYKDLQDGSLDISLNEFDEEYKAFIENYLETKEPKLTRKR